MRSLFSSVLLSVCLLSSVEAVAFGPGMHIREADRTLEMLMETDVWWAQALEETPGALEYLHLGSITPDAEQWVPELTFGHNVYLAYHLLERAEESGDVRLSFFALGFLSHVSGGDRASEQFMAPLVAANSHMGYMNLLMAESGPEGEVEGITEVFGDLITGDFHGVIDVLYFFWLDGEEAKNRARELMLWYCEQAADSTGDNPDCALAVQQCEELLFNAEEYLGGFTREQAHSMVTVLIDEATHADLAGLIFDAATGSSIPLTISTEPSEEFDSEYWRLLRSEVVDPGSFEDLPYFYEPWPLYETMRDVGPSISLWHLLSRPGGSWPTWNEEPLMWGNIRSIMNFLPDEYERAGTSFHLPNCCGGDGLTHPETVHPGSNFLGLIPDGIWYRNPEGTKVETIPIGAQGETWHAFVRFYSAFPFEGRIRGVVKKDRVGVDTTQDEVLGEVVIELEIDPTTYGVRPREVIDIPFQPDTEGALGFYVELYTNDLVLPWFTTNWDRLWHIRDLPMWRASYQDNFGSYGHFPESLPVDGVQRPTNLYVKPTIHPWGGGIAGASVTVGSQTLVTDEAGVAVFESIQPGLAMIQVTAPSYHYVSPLTKTVVEGQDNWVAVEMEVIPDLHLSLFDWGDGLWWNLSLELTLDASVPDYSRLMMASSEATMEDVDGLAYGESLQVQWDPRWGFVSLFFPPPAPVPPDGDTLRIRVNSTFIDGSVATELFSETFRIDTSPAELRSIKLGHGDEPWCPEVMPPQIPVTVVAWDNVSPVMEPRFEDPISNSGCPSDVLEVREEGGTWTYELLVKFDGHQFGDEIRYSVGSCGGSAALRESLLVVRDPSCDPVDPSPEEEDVVSPADVDSDVSDVEVTSDTAGGDASLDGSGVGEDTASGGGGSSGGCSQSGSSSGWLLVPMLLLSLLLLGLRRRSRYSSC